MEWMRPTMCFRTFLFCFLDCFEIKLLAQKMEKKKKEAKLSLLVLKENFRCF